MYPFTYIFTISSTPHSFIELQISGWYQFSFAWRTPFISYSPSLLVIDCFRVCVSSTIFILHSSLRDIFIGHRILEWQFFPSGILQKLFLTVNVFVPLCIMCLFFSFCPSLRFSASFKKKFDYHVPWYSLILISCAWGSLTFLGLWVYLYQIWKIPATFFLKYFFLVPLSYLASLESPGTCILVPWHFHIAHWYSVFFFFGSFFSLCFVLDSFYFNIFKFTHLFFCRI